MSKRVTSHSRKDHLSKEGAVWGKEKEEAKEL